MKRQKKQQLGSKNAINANYNLPTIDPSVFNQTIIINNPNFNISYIETSAAGNQSSNPNLNKGQEANKTQNDSWNLNCNLKEFSQTRQLGFFNANKQRKNHVSKSPYMIPKSRTQDIRGVGKIRANQTTATKDQPKSNRSIPVIAREQSPAQLQTLEPTGNHNLNIGFNNPTNQNHGTLSTFRTKKYGYTKGNPRQIIGEKSARDGSQAHLAKIEDERDRINDGGEVKEALTEKLKNGFLNNGNYAKIKHNVRKNRFSLLEDDQQRERTNRTVHQQDQKHSSDDNRTGLQKLSGTNPKIIDNKIHPRHHKHAHHSGHYNHTIQLIQNSLLSNLNDYMDGEEYHELPGSKIQLYMTTMREPERIHNPINPEYRSTPMEMWDQYDFKFEEEKNLKRPKTPKRKKFYD